MRQIIKTFGPPRETLLNLDVYIKHYLEDQMSIAAIARKYGIDAGSISRNFKLRGLQINMNGAKYQYNTKFFEVIDTEEKAYWLGFIFADGCISDNRNCFTMSLKEGDVEHIRKIQNAICPTKPIKLGKNTLNGKTFGFCRIDWTNKVIVNQLWWHGCLPRKSLKLVFPKAVPDKLIHHFIRGYFDGDGCIGLYNYVSWGGEHIQLRFTGTKEFLTSIQDVFEDKIEGYSRTAVRQEHNSKAFVFAKGGRRVPLEVLHFMYRDSSIYLQRKYDLYLSSCLLGQKWFSVIEEKPGTLKRESERKFSQRLDTRNA
jgi:hypothetical protein